MSSDAAYRKPFVIGGMSKEDEKFTSDIQEALRRSQEPARLEKPMEERAAPPSFYPSLPRLDLAPEIGSINAPSKVPVRVNYIPPQSVSPSYLDVVRPVANAGSKVHVPENVRPPRINVAGRPVDAQPFALGSEPRAHGPLPRSLRNGSEGQPSRTEYKCCCFGHRDGGFCSAYDPGHYNRLPRNEGNAAPQHPPCRRRRKCCCLLMTLHFMLYLGLIGSVLWMGFAVRRFMHRENGTLEEIEQLSAQMAIGEKVVFMNVAETNLTQAAWDKIVTELQDIQFPDISCHHHHGHGPGDHGDHHWHDPHPEGFLGGGFFGHGHHRRLHHHEHGSSEDHPPKDGPDGEIPNSGLTIGDDEIVFSIFYKKMTISKTGQVWANVGHQRFYTPNFEKIDVDTEEMLITVDTKSGSTFVFSLDCFGPAAHHHGPPGPPGPGSDFPPNGFGPGSASHGPPPPPPGHHHGPPGPGSASMAPPPPLPGSVRPPPPPPSTAGSRPIHRLFGESEDTWAPKELDNFPDRNFPEIADLEKSFPKIKDLEKLSNSLPLIDPNFKKDLENALPEMKEDFARELPNLLANPNLKELAELMKKH